jgi:hypothetical protein
MSTNRDASNTTMRRGQLALYTWRQSYNYPAGTTTVFPEQATNSMNQGPTSVVPLNAYVGAQLVGQTNGGNCGCSTAVTLQGYDKKSPASS